MKLASTLAVGSLLLIAVMTSAGFQQQSEPKKTEPQPKKGEKKDNGTVNPNEPGGARIVVQQGTEVVIQTNETIESANADRGRTFDAVIAGNVIDKSGKVLIPKGSKASLLIRDTSSGGEVLSLKSVVVDGREYTVSTTDGTKSAKMKTAMANHRTGDAADSGAPLGSPVAVVVGGGKGGVIGSLTGITGTRVVTTEGARVRVPAESILRFKLEKPLVLRH